MGEEAYENHLGSLNWLVLQLLKIHMLELGLIQGGGHINNLYFQGEGSLENLDYYFYLDGSPF